MNKTSIKKYDTDLEILKRQVIVWTYRSSGPGGQRKNKTETAVRLKHPPSGVSVKATEHRFQSQNLSLALERLQKHLMRLNRPKKRRLSTSIPIKAKERRIEERKIHSQKKRLRQNHSFNRNPQE
jgi:protein subunit release factor B